VRADPIGQIGPREAQQHKDTISQPKMRRGPEPALSSRPKFSQTSKMKRPSHTRTPQNPAATRRPEVVDYIPSSIGGRPNLKRDGFPRVAWSSVSPGRLLISSCFSRLNRHIRQKGTRSKDDRLRVAEHRRWVYRRGRPSFRWTTELPQIITNMVPILCGPLGRALRRQSQVCRCVVRSVKTSGRLSEIPRIVLTTPMLAERLLQEAQVV